MTRPVPTRSDYRYVHVMTTRWRDNDIYAHVNNAVFFEYVDTVVNHWLLTEAGRDVIGGDRVGFVAHSECDYFAPLAFPDPVTGGLNVTRIGRTSVTYDVALFRGDAVEAAAAARFTHVYVDRASGRPLPLDDAFRSALERLAS